MDKDRVVGAAKELKGKIKEGVGKAVGDAKLEVDGKTDQVEGKIQNAIGGLKDAIKKKMVAVVAFPQWLSRRFPVAIFPETIRNGASEFLQRASWLFPSLSPDYAQFRLITIPVTKKESRS